MSLHPDHRHHGRQVHLPSGKKVDVVYFDDRSASPIPHLDTDGDLHVCGACAAELVHPVTWKQEGAAHWRVTLRCPNCEWTGTGVFGQAAVDRFDAELDRGVAVMVRDLNGLMTANMKDEIERFVSALHADHIVPSDF